MQYCIGVDLGTAYTAAAVARDGRVEIATLGTRAIEMPSVAFLREDGQLLFGEAAERRSVTEPTRVAREFKRRMGDSTSVLVGSTPFSAHALMGKLLVSVVSAVAEREGTAPDRVVVTYPANWGAYRLELLGQAIHQADIGDVGVVTEPEAAAAHYASTTRVVPGDTVAVYDLGGGTFDATVLRRLEGGFELLGQPHGIEQLGGVDFDEAVFRHVTANIGTNLNDLDPDDPAMVAAIARLRRDCVDAKEALSYDTATTIPVALPSHRGSVRLTRGELEQMIRPALADTVHMLERAVRSAAVAPADLKAVVLVGGSSRIPLVAQMLGEGLGRPVAIDVHPKHAVALGAARLAEAGVTGPAAAPAPVTARTPATAPGTAPGTTGPPPPPGTAPSPVGEPAGRGGPPWPPGPPAELPAGRPTPGRRRLLAIAGGVGALALDTAVALAAQGDGDGNEPGPSSVRSETTGATEPGGGTTSPGEPGGQGEGFVIFETDRGGLDAPIRSLWAMALDGSRPRRVVQTAGGDGHPTFSSNGRRLAYLHTESPDTPDADNSWQLMVSAPDGSGSHVLVDGVGRYFRPAWSPDDTAIVIPLEVDGQVDLWRIDANTGDREPVTDTPEPEFDPDWSPDGTRIVYRRDVGGDPEIFVLDVASGGETQLTSHPGYDSDPRWSPDGTHILFTSDVGGSNEEILSMRADGTDVRTLSNDPAKDHDAIWTSDGTTIIFVSERDGGDVEIYAMSPDGEDQRRLTDNPGYDGVPDAN
ncbi:MAG TPA: Hsp70 family protein [Acidimicrobiales bacterium]|nr:Hsp70 family protein [Acidimicrobiales bacterium]